MPHLILRFLFRRFAIRLTVPLAVLAVATGAQAADLVKLNIGFTATAEPVIVFAAKDENFLAKRGFDANLQLINSGSTVVAGLVSGSLQFGSLPPSVLLQAVDGGIDLVLVSGEASSVKTSKNSALVVRTGANIKTPADLIGKRVAVSGVTSISHIFARRWLADIHVDAKKINFIEIPFSNHADAIRAGNVDAAVTAEPVVSRLASSGAGTPLHYMASTLPEGIPMISLAATRKWAEANPAAVKAIREALVESKAALAADPAKARQLFEKYLKLSPAVAATTEIPALDVALPAPMVQWWIDEMTVQGMLRTKFTADKVILK